MHEGLRMISETFCYVIGRSDFIQSGEK